MPVDTFASTGRASSPLLPITPDAPLKLHKNIYFTIHPQNRGVCTRVRHLRQGPDGLHFGRGAALRPHEPGGEAERPGGRRATGERQGARGRQHRLPFLCQGGERVDLPSASLGCLRR